jgi:hypothetical protein
VRALLTTQQETRSSSSLDALDGAGETGGRTKTADPFMNHLVSSMPHDRFACFADFYPHYLAEHRTPACRRLHFVGTFLVLGLLLAAIVTGRWWLTALMPLAGYAFAWLGHFAFEHNKPATFKHPVYSLIADFVMFRDMLLGRIRL